MRLVLLRGDLLQEELDLISAMMVATDGNETPKQRIAKILLSFVDMLSSCDDELLEELIGLFGEAVVIDMVDILSSRFKHLETRTGIDILKAEHVVLDIVHNVLAIATKH
jgi:hypothetical protein